MQRAPKGFVRKDAASVSPNAARFSSPGVLPAEAEQLLIACMEAVVDDPVGVIEIIDEAIDEAQHMLVDADRDALSESLHIPAAGTVNAAVPQTKPPPPQQWWGATAGSSRSWTESGWLAATSKSVDRLSPLQIQSKTYVVQKRQRRVSFREPIAEERLIASCVGRCSDDKSDDDDDVPLAKRKRIAAAIQCQRT